MKNAFTVIEVAIVIALAALFLAASVPALRSFQRVSDLDRGFENALNALRLAQSRTLASENQAQYGVHFDTATTPHEYTLFQGATYDTRDPAQDETTQLPGTIQISLLALGGGDEVAFRRLSGEASLEGSIQFSQIADPSRTKTLSIHLSGTAEETPASPPADDNRVKDSRHVHVPYQGRTISTETESVRLVFSDTTFSFAIADTMSGGQIFWEGDVTSAGEAQHLRVQTHLLNDPGQGTLFSVHRSGDLNTKGVSLELSGDATGDVLSYDDAGITSQGTSVYARAPEIQ